MSPEPHRGRGPSCLARSAPVLVAAVVVAWGLVSTPGAWAAAKSAAAITVTTSADVIANDGLCSLREAITAANTDQRSGTAAGECPAGSPSAVDTIDLPAGTYTLTREGRMEDGNLTGDLDVSSDMTLVGAGAGSSIIDGGSIDRVVDVLSGAVTLSAIAIIRGIATDVQGEGPVNGGGGIRNRARLSLIRSMVADSRTTSIDVGGGGILNSRQGDLTLSDSSVVENLARSGGGITNEGVLHVTGSVIQANRAFSGGGGGIYSVFGGRQVITRTRFADNDASDLGRAIWVAPGAGLPGGIDASTTVAESTFAEVDHGGGRGVIAAFGSEFTLLAGTLRGLSTDGVIGGDGTTRVINSTLGLASVVLDSDARGSISVINSTLVNSLLANRSIHAGTVTVTNSILAGEFGECIGTITDGGHNIGFPTIPSCPATFSTADPKLVSFAGHGGPTEAFSIAPDSAAVDAGDNGVCSAAVPDGAGGKDQRGAARGGDGNGDGVGGCDIGAFELDDADLAVTATAPSAVTAGSTMVLLVKLSNLGPLGDSGVSLTETLPAGTTYLSYTATQGTCTPPAKKASVVRCTVGPIEAGGDQDAAIAIKVATSARGDLQSVARVSGARFDPDLSNNTAVSVTQAVK